ncbi:hypothetical protein LUZ60_010690 [Juncus effusus]|nr:hypothetical protein LUZ60_010690 [Juncus effusus]
MENQADFPRLFSTRLSSPSPSSSSRQKEIPSFSVLSCSQPSCIYLEIFSNTRCAYPKCQYTYQYADGSHTTGILARETFTFGSSDPSVPVSVLDMVFGCSRDSTTDFSSSSGIVGLAMGNLSLVQYLDSPSAYIEVREKVRSIVNLPVSSDTIDDSIDLCFKSNSIPDYLPDMIFHFEGGDLAIPKENYLLVAPGRGLFCLTMMEFSTQSILGAYQQQNMHVLYDIDKMMLSFEPAKCSKGGDMNCKETKGPNKGFGSFRFSPASLIFSIFIAFLTLLCI